MVLALVFGLVFAVGRLSEHRWIRVPAGVVVEFFRAVPLLLMIFFVFVRRAVPHRATGRRRSGRWSSA